MIAEQVKESFDAKTFWLDQPDTMMPLSIEVKEFAKFVIRTFGLRAENLIISDYQKIVNDGNNSKSSPRPSANLIVLRSSITLVSTTAH